MSTVTFNGYDLSKLIKVHWDIDPEILPAVDDRTTTVGDRNGSLFLHRRIGERVITMDYTMLNADEAKRQELTRVLNVSEPKQLILGKQPDRYYMAMPKGDISRGTKGWNDWSTIDWIVYEPYAHSVDTHTADNTPYKDVPVNLLTGTNDQPQTATGTDYLISKVGTFVPVKGKQYTAIVRIVKKDNPLHFEVWTMSGNNRVSKIVTTIAEEFVSKTFIAPDADNYDNIAILLAWTNGTDKGSYTWSEAKVANGTTASPWSPNPADPEYYADTITLTNNGTVPTPVSFTVTNRSDNGYFGVVNDQAILQEGNPDEIDGYNYKLNTLMWINSFESDDEFKSFDINKYASNYQPHADRLTGSFKAAPGLHGDWRAYPDYQRGTNNQIWYGPSMYKPFVGTPENWRADVSLQTKANGRKSMGVMEWSIVDANGKMIAGFRIRKIDWLDTGLELFVMIGPNGEGAVNNMDNVVEKWTGPAKTWIIRDFFGHMTIEKDGNYLRMKFKNETTNAPWGRSFYVPDMAQAAGLLYWTGAVGQGDALDQSLFFIRSWDNSTAWADSKNIFGNGDILTIETTDKLSIPYLNGIKVLGLQAPGSKPIMAPPGKSTITLAHSNFAKPPKVEATFRERWL